jgi:hypothetical protein
LEAGNKFGQPDGGYLVVFEVKSEEKLFEVSEFLDKQSIQSVMFFEPDDNMNYTAICTQPIGEDQKRLFHKYKLWKL